MTLGGIVSVLTLLSTLGAGFLGIPVVIAVGPPLVMGLRIITGETEPLTPVLAWPVWTTVLLLLMPLPFVWRREWHRAALAGLPFALLPWVQLFRLYPLTRP